MGEGMNGRIVLHHHARPEDDIGFNQHVLADERIMAEENRLRRNQGSTIAHHGKASAALPFRLAFSQFDPAVDAIAFPTIRFHDCINPPSLHDHTYKLRNYKITPILVFYYTFQTG